MSSQKHVSYATHSMTLGLARAVAMLREPIPDRDREFAPFADHILLIDDSGASTIESFDDALACHYFLKFLDAQRAKRKAVFEISARRSAIKLVGGGE